MNKRFWGVFMAFCLVMTSTVSYAEELSYGGAEPDAETYTGDYSDNGDQSWDVYVDPGADSSYDYVSSYEDDWTDEQFQSDSYDEETWSDQGEETWEDASESYEEIVETETQTESEKQTEAFSGTLEAEISGTGGTLRAEIPEGVFNEPVTMYASGEIYTPDGYYMLNSVLGAAGKSTETDQIYNLLVLTLTFYNAYGEQVQPNGTISVTANMSVDVGAGSAEYTENYFFAANPYSGSVESVWCDISKTGGNSISYLAFSSAAFNSPFVLLTTGPLPEETEEETEEQSESETETEEESEEDEEETETEEWDGYFDIENPAWGGIMTANLSGGLGGTITAEVPEGAFDEMVTLMGSASACSADGADPSTLSAVSAAANVEESSVYGLYMANIYFINGDGEIVDPSLPVTITVDTSVSPVDVNAGGKDANAVICVMGESGASVVGDVVTLNADNQIAGLAFSTSTFSPFVVVVSGTDSEEETEEETEIETETETEEETETETETETEEADEKVYTAGDGGVMVTVTAPAGAFPDEADLQVVLYGESSSEYKEAAEAIGVDAEEASELAAIDESDVTALAGVGAPEEVEGTGLAVVDICFMADGVEVEPEEAVDVKIDASGILPKWADATTVEIAHLEDGGSPVIVSEGSPVAEFEVESFSAFTVTWEAASGGGQGSSYSVNVTAYLDEIEIDGIANQLFTSQDDELDFVTLLNEVGYGSGDYTFQYAVASVNGTSYGSEEISLVAIELTRSGTTQQFELVFRDGSVETFTASTARISVDAYYTTPDFSVSIEALGMDEETEEWILQAVISHTGDYVSVDYEWTTDSDMAYVRFTDNTGEAFIAWADDVEDNTEVTVKLTVTLTYEDGTTATAYAEYVLEYNDETVDLYMTYGPNKDPLPAGVEVTVSNGSHDPYTGTTDEDGVVHDLEIVPGIYTVTATYTDDDGNTYRCSESVAMHDAGNYYVNLNYYDETILTAIPERENWEHVDVKLSFGTTGSSSGNYSAEIIGAQIISGEDGTVKYTATEDSIEGNDNEFQLTFYEGENTSGTPSHNVSFSTGDYIVLTYYLYLDGVQQGEERTIVIYTDTTYADGTTYPADGERAYKLYNYLYGTSFVSDAQLQEAGITEIDISGMSMMLVAAILCDSSEVTGAGQVQAASSQANQWGMDFALSIESMVELSANWQFSVTKTYENASMRAGDFTFNLYASDANWGDGSLLMTLTNSTSGIGSDGNSYDTMTSFPISYDDADIEAQKTYYYILEEVKDTVSSGTEGVNITFDGTIYYITVKLGVDEETGEATVTATYKSSTGGSGSADNFSFVNTYQGFTEISGSKTWNDNGNESARPESITVILLQNGIEYATTLASASTEWAWSFTELPLYNGTTEYTYTIQEVEVPGYTTTVDGYDLINTLTGTMEITGIKTWDDNDNQDGKRPDEITINLLANDEVIDTVTVTAADDWTWSFTDLSKYDADGKEILYTITEDQVEGYETVVDGYNITNIYTSEKIDIEGTKTWDDNDNQDGKRPASITIRLYADGTEIASKTVTEDDEWTWSFTDLPKYADGEEITYSVTEDVVPDYSTTYSEDGYSVTNTHTPDQTSLTVMKVWDDNNDQDGVRPDEITVELLADGEETGMTLTLDESNSWVGSFTELDKYEDSGTEIEYTVKELEIEDYTSEITGDATIGYSIVNTHNPETTEIDGSKTWDDADNQDGIRPASITIHLFADEEEVDSKTVTANDGWAWSFTDLPKYANGAEIVYTISEDAADGYESEIDGYDVTNSHIPETIDIEGTKTWDDADDQDGKRPASITVNLLANGESAVDENGNPITAEVTADDDWAWSFTDLPKYADGVEITYTITEDVVEDYTTEIEGYDITNSYEPGKTSLNVQKVWDDNDDQDGVRPEEITVKLVKNGDETGDELTLSESNDWSGTFDDLDEYTDGEQNEYTVAEVEVEDYDCVITQEEGTTSIVITNTHEPETIDIEGSKVWDDNSEGDRPDSITVNLLADGEPAVDEDGNAVTAEVTADDDWTWSFTDLPKYADGKEIEYSIEEIEVDGYDTEITGDAENGFTITNTADYKELSISKEVSGEGDSGEYEFEIKLTKDGEPYEGEVKTDGGDTLTFSGGTATITVAAGETVILEIFDGMDWEISEVSEGADSVLIYVDGTAVERPADKSKAYAAIGTIHDTTQVEFVNSYRQYFPIDEEIVTDMDDIFDRDAWVKEEAVNEYNAIEIEMTTNLPVITGYDLENGNFTMNFHEVLDSQLVLDTADADFSVYIGGTQIDHSFYTVTIDPGDGCSFHVDVDLTALYLAGVVTEDMLDGNTEITIFFFADLEGTGLNGTYTSTIWYEVADDGEILYTSNVDVVSVYTYDVRILKYDESALNGDDYAGAALAGATLGVYYDASCSDPVIRNGAAYTGTSGSDGYVDFYGLVDGTYYVKEIAAPANYKLSDEVLTLTIGGDSSAYELYFANTPDTEIPGNPENPTKSVDVGSGTSVQVGDELTYTITFYNPYEESVEVTITDELENGLTYVDGSAGDDAFYDEGTRTITWTFAAPAMSYGSVSFRAIVNENAGEQVENDAVVQIWNDAAVRTNKVENPIPNTETEPGPVPTPTPDEPVPPEKFVDIDGDDDFDDNKEEVRAGDELTYEITYYNHHTAGTTVTITDKLEENLEYVEGSASDGGVYDEETGTITWSVWADPESGGSVTFKVKVLSGAESAGKVVNTATVQIGSDTPQQTNEVENPLNTSSSGTGTGGKGGEEGSGSKASSVKTDDSTPIGPTMALLAAALAVLAAVFAYRRRRAQR